jgi:hypothetical protein
VVDQKLGSFVGIACALGIALGGYEAVREQRMRLLVPTAPSRRPDALPSGHESG